MDRLCITHCVSEENHKETKLYDELRRGRCDTRGRPQLHAGLLGHEGLAGVVDAYEGRRVHDHAAAQRGHSLHDAGGRETRLRVVVPALLHRVADRQQALQHCLFFRRQTNFFCMPIRKIELCRVILFD